MSKTFKIMCVNAGSSSLKFKLYERDEGAKNETTLSGKATHLKALTNGIVERIGHEDGIFTIKKPGGFKHTEVLPVHNHDEAAKLVLEGLKKFGVIEDIKEIAGVGNRVVQGGKYFSDSALFDDYAYSKIKELIPLDPLHAQAHLTCFDAFKKALPEAGEVAVFDTSFHQTMEAKEYRYPLPYEYYEKYAVRRYGAHGTSHKYLSIRAKETYFPKQEHVNIITCHIGSGASLAAIKDGKCIATSMGLTPLAGVRMGTRTGDIDPSCMPYLVSCTGKSAEELYSIFNHESGLLGISGISNDTRDVEDAYYKGDKRSILAVDRYAQRIADYISRYYGKLGHVDRIVCSAGVFENAPLYREKTFSLLTDAFGIKLDEKLNAETRLGKEGIISTKDSKVPVAVIPTDEELRIALDTARILGL
ncbi:MAG: acetate kinase [Mollicutes bacterium]|nr:acetate kinase [Mollicutes bacterium]MDY4782900.1 acetate kinase [Candidatus Enterosoma sp.]